MSLPRSDNKPFETHNERDKEDDRGQSIEDPVNFRKEEVDVGGSVGRHFERNVPCHGKNESKPSQAHTEEQQHHHYKALKEQIPSALLGTWDSNFTENPRF